MICFCFDRIDFTIKIKLITKIIFNGFIISFFFSVHEIQANLLIILIIKNTNIFLNVNKFKIYGE
jgi:hypothetical protein